MKKLELKHLAGYLPYGLSCVENMDDGVKIEFTLEVLNISNVIDDIKYSNSILPILRQLSDLTKEIEVNGEKFVPVIEYDYLRFEEISTFKGGCNAMKFIQARELELLYEMHFDIHGLIEKGLAIDINNL